MKVIFFLAAVSLFFSFTQKKKIDKPTIIYLKLSNNDPEQINIRGLYSDVLIKEINSGSNYRTYECTIPSSYTEDQSVVVIQQNGITVGNLADQYQLSLKDIRKLSQEENNIYVFPLSN